jgi:hypothetical protein
VTALAIWTVYDHPSDYPDRYVARCFEVDADGPRSTGNILLSTSLDTIRTAMRDMGLIRMARWADDDANIIETWM